MATADFRKTGVFLMLIPATRRPKPTPNEAPYRHLVLFKFNAAPAAAVIKVAADFAA